MVLFFRLLARFFVIAFAYLIACFAATLVLAAAIFGGWPGSQDLLPPATPQDLVSLFFQMVFGFFSFAGIFSSSLPPFALAVLASEALSLRSWIYHVGGGGALASFLLMSADVYEGKMPPRQDMMAVLAAGFVAGFVYWLLAGRASGSWRLYSKRSAESDT